MVTGDNLKTASAIADKAGIFKTGDIAMEGPEFRKLTPSQLDEMLPRLTVLAARRPRTSTSSSRASTARTSPRTRPVS